MCGIAGILEFSRVHDVGEMGALLRSMAATIRHRGPDDEGFWISADNRVGLAHRRLSIIDLSEAGHQPMLSGDGRYCITFNGEIYNYQELRISLASKGSRFTSHSDTEVIIEAYRHYGADCVTHFDGMFAFAIYDTVLNELFAARDPFGEKPFYYYLDEAVFTFASELTAIKKCPRVSDEVLIDDLAGYLCLQFFDGSESIYRDVKKLRPGHTLRIFPDNRVVVNRYYEFEINSNQRDIRDPELVDELEDILVRSIERRLRADVPVGAFLSGGVDSSTVVALATRKLGRQIKTYSIGFRGWDGSEHWDAEAVARHLGTDHTTEMLDVDCLSIEAEISDRIDEPLGDSSSIPTYLVSRLARKQVKVALSGDGADELFGGYGRYFTTLAEERVGETRLSRGERYYSSRAFVYTDQEVEQMMAVLPPSFAGFLYRLRQEVNDGKRSLIDAMRKTDIEHYLAGDILVKVDRMSMLNSLEVRSPFLNVELAEFAAALPGACLADGQAGKYLLKQVAERHLPREWLDRPKRGFGIPPYQWGGGVLYDKVMQRYGKLHDRNGWWVDSAGVQKWLSAHAQDKDSINHKLYTLLQVQNYIDSHSAMPVVQEDNLKLRSLRDQLNGKRKSYVVFTAYATEVIRHELPSNCCLVSLWGEAQGESWLCHDWIKEPVSAFKTALQHVGKTVHEVVFLELGRESAMGVLDAIASEGVRCGHVFEEMAWELVHPENRKSWWLEIQREYRSPMLFDSRTKESIRYRWHDVWRDLLQDVRGTWLQLRTGSTGSAGLFEESLGLIRRDTPMRGIMLLRECVDWNKFYFYERGFLARLGRYLDQSSVFDDVDSPVRKLCFFIGSLARGGAERQVVNMASQLQYRGYQVTVMTMFSAGADNHYQEFLESIGVNVVDVSHPNPLVSIREIEEKLPEEAVELLSAKIPLVRRHLWPAVTHLLYDKPDVSICYLDGTNIIGGIASLLTGVGRVITSFRSINPTHFNFYQSWYPKYYKALYRSRKVLLTGNSQVGIDSYSDWLGLKPGRVKLFRNGLDFSHFDEVDSAKVADVRGLMGVTGTQSPPVVGGVFRLSREKRPKLFVDVISQVVSDIPELKAFMVGGGPMKFEVREYIEEAGLSNSIFLFDSVHDVAPFLSISDLLLMTSDIEGTSNAVLEAQYMRKPVVVTSAGGAFESLVDGKSGYVCSEDDPDAIASKVVRLIGDHQLAAEMGEFGREFVINNYSLKVAVNNLQALFK